MNKLKILELALDENGFTKDINGNPVHFENNPLLAYPGVIFPLTQEHIQEIYKCSQDIYYFIENYVQIFSDGQWIVPTLRDYQRRIIDGYINNRFVNVMAGRQSGKSVSTCLYVLWQIIFSPNKIVGMVANKAEMAQENLDRIKTYYEYLPIWLKPGVKKWNVKSISLENGSKIYTDGVSKGSLRGKSCGTIFCDEVSFVNRWNEFADAVEPTISSFSDGQLIYTTTPNGRDHFWRMWRRAELQESEFINVKVEWWEVPGRDEKWKDEMIRTMEGGSVGFARNYACEFEGSSFTLIEATTLSRLSPKNPIIIDKFMSGFKIYEEPIEGHNYIMAVDPAKKGIDGFAIQIVDITKLPFKQVACGSFTNITYLKTPPILKDIGIYFNNAFMIIENNEGAGQSISDLLWQVYEYEHLYKAKGEKIWGHRTTAKTRPKLLSQLKMFIEHVKLEILDASTINEFNGFVEKNGKYQADNGYKDDLVMALSFVFVPFLNINSFNDFDKFVQAIEQDISEEVEDTLAFVSVGYFDDGNIISNNGMYPEGVIGTMNYQYNPQQDIIYN